MGSVAAELADFVVVTSDNPVSYTHLVLTEDVALVVQHLFYQIGGIQIAAVDGGCLGPDQLQGRDVEGLSEGVDVYKRQRSHTTAAAPAATAFPI